MPTVEAATMAQNSAKFTRENGALAGVASVVVASMTSPYMHQTHLSLSLSHPGKNETGVMQHTEITGMFQVIAHGVYWCDPTVF
jgi:hypothetical protein